MMKNYSAIVCASVLAFALSACGGGDATNEGDTTGLQPGETDVASEPAVTSAEGGDASTTRQTTFGATALVTSPVNNKVRSLPSLTPSASVESRVNSTSSGKADPFAGRVISVRPVPPAPGDVEASFPLAGRGTSPASDLGNALVGNGRNASAGGSSPVRTSGRGGGGSTAVASSRGASAAGGGGTSTTANRGGGSAAGSGGGGGAVAGGGSLPDLAARPPIPDPALARAVEVTGVVLVGSNYQAILKAPNEPTSRYVSAGQRLSGGRILVKRIENQGSEPVVILEEDGVEVVRSIGAPVEGSAGGATAMLPELLPAS